MDGSPMGPFATESREKASSRTVWSPPASKTLRSGFTSLQAMQPPTSNSRNWRKRVVRSALHFEVPSVGICTVTRFAEELLEIVMVIAIVD
jgi:hypothetical protein